MKVLPEFRYRLPVVESPVVATSPPVSSVNVEAAEAGTDRLTLSAMVTVPLLSQLVPLQDVLASTVPEPSWRRLRVRVRLPPVPASTTMLPVLVSVEPEPTASAVGSPLHVMVVS